NAAQAIPHGNANHNEIRITTTCAEGQVLVEIQDTGVGIPPEHLSRLFDPFFTTKPVGVGTGLGLSICHEIVTSFGGQMGVESREGHGSTFWLLLDALPPEARAEAPRAPAEAAPTVRRGRVLVVDDEPMIGTAIRRTLQREHEVVTLTSAREAFARLMSGERFDVILCDVMMPEMSGVDLHQQLAQHLPALAEQLIFLSGGAFTPKAREFLAQVGNRRVDKPFSARDLRDMVQAVLEHAPGA
ncbi:MAG TPA: ATP-binding protein, partial [Cystobacter sp.]